MKIPNSRLCRFYGVGTVLTSIFLRGHTTSILEDITEAPTQRVQLLLQLRFGQKRMGKQGENKHVPEPEQALTVYRTKGEGESGAPSYRPGQPDSPAQWSPLRGRLPTCQAPMHQHPRILTFSLKGRPSTAVPSLKPLSMYQTQQGTQHTVTSTTPKSSSCKSIFHNVYFYNSSYQL